MIRAQTRRYRPKIRIPYGTLGVMVAGSKKEREGGEAQKDSNAVANPGNVGSESDPAPEGQGAEEGETRWGERRYADTNFGAHGITLEGRGRMYCGANGRVDRRFHNRRFHI